MTLDDDMAATEKEMAKLFPTFVWTGSYGSGEYLRYTLRSSSSGEIMVLDRHLNVLRRKSLEEVKKAAEYMDAMETED